MRDTSLRRIQLLQLLPRAPLEKTTAELVDSLRNLGYEVGQRTVQRDLNDLSLVFPLEHSTQGKTYHWCWAEDAELLDLPGMNSHTALAFFLTEQYLADMMPPAVVDGLESHFYKAKRVLKQDSSETSEKWIDKIRILPEAMPLESPVPERKAVEDIYTALLEERTFSARYRKRESGKTEYYEQVRPLGLVFRHRLVYLIATLMDYDDPVQFVLHRFKSVTINAPAKLRPSSFNLQNYIDEGGFDFGAGEPINVELLFHPETMKHLLETPLSRNQQVSNTRDGRVRLSARVRNSSRLRWWLQSFGEYAEVVKPVSLRREFTETARRLAAMYDT